MKPSNRGEPSRRPIHFPTLAILLVAASCTPPARTMRPLKGPHQVTLTFDEKGCPAGVVVDTLKRCPDVPAADQPKCLLTFPKERVDFLVTDASGVIAPAELLFSLDFDPFKKGGNDVKVKKGTAHPLTLHPNAPLGTFTYQVTSGTCPVLDPQIIIRP
jgi:hypothetical protein